MFQDERSLLKAAAPLKTPHMYVVPVKFGASVAVKVTKLHPKK
jgi:hypothetical protein